MKNAKLLLAKLVIVLFSVGLALGQDVTCNSGDIAWVSAAVNANVGLGSGAGRCLSNTVAGANYNDPSVPFGIQAALDCACSGSQIRVLGNTGDYGSSTASWNNRFDATKEIRSVNTVSNAVSFAGWADDTTSCEVNNDAVGCPVLLDFAGGTGIGLSIRNQPYFVVGLEIANATTTGLLLQTSVIGAGLVVRDSGGWGVSMGIGTSTASVVLVRSLVINNGAITANTGGITTVGTNANILYSSILENTGTGVGFNSSRSGLARSIVQGNSGDGIQMNHNAGKLMGNTIRGNGGNGIGVSSTVTNASYSSSLLWNLIADNVGWGINSARHSSRSAGLFAYNVLGGNGSGDINLALMPNDSWATQFGNVLGAAVVFASATDSRVVSGAEIVLTYPRGLTTVDINAGVAPDELANPTVALGDGIMGTFDKWLGKDGWRYGDGVPPGPAQSPRGYKPAGVR